MIQTLI